MLFWWWVGALMVEEVRQRWQARKASLYFRTAANKLDAVIMLIFTVAFLCRVAELLSETARQPGTAANAIGRAHIGHTVGHAMLCINVILCAIRLLYMIAALSPRLAILIIMARRMICEDVAPFLCVCRIPPLLPICCGRAVYLIRVAVQGILGVRGAIF
eukprot:COSAG01_NODE_156_length_23748_cov_439.062371_19_plen_160_part_00